MNELLGLRGSIQSQPYAPGQSRSRNVNKNQYFNLSKFKVLIDQLKNILLYWESQDRIFENIFITIKYVDLISKSRRSRIILAENNKSSTHQTVVGVKFSDDLNKKHEITHYVPIEYLRSSIKKLEDAYKTFTTYINEEIVNKEVINNIINQVYDIDYTESSVKRTSFSEILVDIANIECFYVEDKRIENIESHIISFYQTEYEINKLLKDLDIQYNQYRVLDTNTAWVTPDALEKILNVTPYIISMAVTDLSNFDTYSDNEIKSFSPISIPSPSNEPTIGVIDTHFDKSVYFSDWVEYRNMIDPNIMLESKDYNHGTAVSSIIVDGPSFNSALDDGCGRFKVRHFGVTSGEKFSAFTLANMIKSIVIENKDIKVWNLSLGSDKEINKNYISPIAAILDELQSNLDVIFVVAGTNDTGNTNSKLIGSPADSLNSIVVNSVSKEGKIVDYSRHGPVLSFFNKPDISYYGGTRGDEIIVCKPLGEDRVTGTSFAAPWIARKISYLVDILKLPREVAKALIIDSAVPWETNDKDINTVGYGIVPIKIEEVVKGKNDEIKFYIYDRVRDFYNYSYNIPVPLDIKTNCHPYYSKITLTYFPRCSRNQGVDYSNTELNIKFGRLDDKSKINSFNKDKQYEVGAYTTEEDARSEFRKWDNTKVLKEKITTNHKGPQKISNGSWGFRISATDRLNNNNALNLNYGLVITLKERNGKNRINKFINDCRARQWIVTPITIENQLEIQNLANQEIEFDI